MSANNSVKSDPTIFCSFISIKVMPEKTGNVGLSLGLLNISYGLLAFVLNFWFIITFACYRSVREKQNILLCELSVSDLCNGILVQLIFGVRLILESFGDYRYYCWMRTLTFLLVSFFFVISYLTLTLM